MAAESEADEEYKDPRKPENWELDAEDEEHEAYHASDDVEAADVRLASDAVFCSAAHSIERSVQNTLADVAPIISAYDKSYYVRSDG